ncbi:MAG TPA: trimeric intracellular cation channel family protein [Vicinamibacterales bacterium]|nr:trimeric intracellular cation channel family protein [Vicinamibacterales bacterium]
MIGTAVFAVTGVLAVNRRGLDVFGAIVLGTVTSLGGGTIRDVVIGAPVFWLSDLDYVWAALAASLAAFVATRSFVSTLTLLLYLDGLGAALFAVAATEKVLSLRFAAIVAVIMGVLTSIGGGLARDVLAGRPTLLMSREIYATPVLIGCTLYVVLRTTGLESQLLTVLTCAVIFSIRAAAIRWHIEMPAWLTSQHDVPPARR